MITVIQAQGGALLIGEISTMSPPELTVISPRVIQLKQAGPGQVHIDFATIIGDPKEIYLNREHLVMHYIPSEALVTLYREAVTGLTLAKAIPPAEIIEFPRKH